MRLRLGLGQSPTEGQSGAPHIQLYIIPVFVRKGLSTVCFCGQGVCRIGEAWRMRACGREGWGWGTNGGEVA